ncbi:hypothetical protein BB559_004791 [Furculomyces boomerangus]|uniref:EF-hand domain-containing protein n=2 Tax=Harpellales TaxID=61421 RepID=A0A2T9YCR7_9FUNG|nr:hypothetical protein BB559_004791 [Furculomyces boomerangus]PVZ99296.1 hypothetical protein BB558_004683 [Smittium angustum]
MTPPVLKNKQRERKAIDNSSAFLQNKENINLLDNEDITPFEIEHNKEESDPENINNIGNTWDGDLENMNDSSDNERQFSSYKSCEKKNYLANKTMSIINEKRKSNFYDEITFDLDYNDERCGKNYQIEEFDLVGKTMFVFSSNNKIRIFLCRAFSKSYLNISTFFALIVQVLFLSIYPVNTDKDLSAMERASMVATESLIIFFGIITFAKAIVSGLFFSPDTNIFSTLKKRWIGFKSTLGIDNENLSKMDIESENKLYLNENGYNEKKNTEGSSKYHIYSVSRVPIMRRFFEFMDVICFVIYIIAYLYITNNIKLRNFALGITSFRFLRFFKMSEKLISLGRSFQIGRTVILRATMYLVVFFFIFGLIGNSSFGKIQRNVCVDRETHAESYPQQVCSGQIIENKTVGFFYSDFTLNSLTPMGRICPSHQYCLSGENIYSKFISFENAYSSFLMTFLISTGQGWTDIMYSVMDGKSSETSIYFIVIVIIAQLCLVDIIVAVTIEMFSRVRQTDEKTARRKSSNVFISTFYALKAKSRIKNKDQMTVLNIYKKWAQAGKDEDNKLETHKLQSSFIRMYHNTVMGILKCLGSPNFWIGLILLDVFLQFLMQGNTFNQSETFEKNATKILIILFWIEIILNTTRHIILSKHVDGIYTKIFLVLYGDRGIFWNFFDIVITLMTTLGNTLNLSQTNLNSMYLFFSTFRMIRLYSNLDSITKVMKQAVGNVSRSMSLIFAIFGIISISAFFSRFYASSTYDPELNFYDYYLNFYNYRDSWIFNFQLFSGADLSNIIFAKNKDQEDDFSRLIFITYNCLYYFFTNYILLNAVTALIMSNFEMFEKDKRYLQLQIYYDSLTSKVEKYQNKDIVGWWNIYRYLPKRPELIKCSKAPNNQSYSIPKEYYYRYFEQDSEINRETPANLAPGISSYDTSNHEYSGMNTLKLLDQNSVSGMNRDAMGINKKSIKHDIDATIYDVNFVNLKTLGYAMWKFRFDHPTYELSLFIFSPENKIRKFCIFLDSDSDSASEHHNSGTNYKREQTLFFSDFTPSFEKSDTMKSKILGNKKMKQIWFIYYMWKGIKFITLILSAVSLLQNSLTEQLQSFILHQEILSTNHKFIAAITLFVFFIEAIIRSIAYGVFMTPKPIFKRPMMLFDMLLLISQIIYFSNILNNDRLVQQYYITPVIILRIINQIEPIRKSLYNVLFSNLFKIVQALSLFMALLIPWALSALGLWGGGMLYQCNDRSVEYKTECVGTFVNSVGILVPRVWENPLYYNFDNIYTSMFAVIGSVSNEGWSDMMRSTMNIKGPNLNPVTNNSWFYAIWDLSKQLEELKPEKYHPNKYSKTFKKKIYLLATQKNTRYTKFKIAILILNILVMVFANYNRSKENTTVSIVHKSIVYSVFFFDILIKIIGIGFVNTFTSINNVFFVILAISEFLLSFVFEIYGYSEIPTVLLTYKLFIALDQTNEFLLVASRSLWPISNLIISWLFFSSIYAVLCSSLFGLTRAGPQFGLHAHFWGFWDSLLTLIRFSFGENWNYFLQDLAVSEPYCSNYRPILNISDCGNGLLSYIIFISYNILSMYIFTNLCSVLILDNFVYFCNTYSNYKLLSRNDIRMFKSLWSDFDPKGTGKIHTSQLVKFVNHLYYPFDLKQYSGNYKIKELVKFALAPINPGEKVVTVEIKCSNINNQPDSNEYSNIGTNTKNVKVYNINLSRLNKALEKVGTETTIKRRHLFNSFINLAESMRDYEGYISMTNMLKLLALKCLVDPRKCLLIQDVLEYSNLEKAASELATQKKIAHSLQRFYYRTKYLKLNPKFSTNAYIPYRKKIKAKKVDSIDTTTDLESKSIYRSSKEIRESYSGTNFLDLSKDITGDETPPKTDQTKTKSYQEHSLKPETPGYEQIDYQSYLIEPKDVAISEYRASLSEPETSRHTITISKTSISPSVGSSKHEDSQKSEDTDERERYEAYREIGEILEEILESKRNGGY